MEIHLIVLEVYALKNVPYQTKWIQFAKLIQIIVNPSGGGDYFD